MQGDRPVFRVLAAPVLFVTFWVFYAVFYLGFHWAFRHSHATRVWVSLAVLALLFIANAMTDRRRLESFALFTGPGRKRPVTIFVPFVGMGSTINPLSAEYARSAIKQLSSLLLFGPRLVTEAVRSLGRYRRVLTLDTEACAAVLRGLAASRGPRPVYQLLQIVP